jgi:predicted HicB family RNase H-like nuclease
MSKFKIGPVSSQRSPEPATREEFVSGASLIRSQAGSRPVKPIRLNLDLDPEIHKRLKLRAVETETSVAALVRDLIVRELN